MFIKKEKREVDKEEIKEKQKDGEGRRKELKVSHNTGVKI